MSDAAQKKAPKPANPAEHPKYSEMVKAALAALKDRTGSSRQAIEKHIKANYKVGDKCGTYIKLALKRLAEKTLIIHTKGVGASGSFKLNKEIKEAKPKKVAKKPVAKKVVKKPVAKKVTKAKSPKKSIQTKKPVAEKPKKAGAKKPVAKPKPAAKKPVAKKPAEEKPVAKKPAEDKPVAKKPAAKKPVAKKPAAKKPAKKVAAKPATSDQRPAEFNNWDPIIEAQPVYSIYRIHPIYLI